MMVDEAVNSQGIGVGITLRSPSWQYKEGRSIRLDYPFSNNQAEYEALVLRFQWALEAGIDTIEAFSDSQVVVGEVNGEYFVNSESLKLYAIKVNLLVAQFQYLALTKTDQSLNEATDKVAKVASREAPTT